MFRLMLNDRIPKRFSLAIQMLWAIAISAIILRTAVAIYDRSHPEALISLGAWSKISLYIGVPVLLSVCFRSAYNHFIEGLYLLLSPAVGLLLIQSIIWITPSNLQQDGISVPAERAGTNDLFIFIFDGWSYERTFDAERKLVDDMPNLSHVMDNATFYARAYSPGVVTELSMTRFLFQNETDEWTSYRKLHGTHGTGITPGGKCIFDLLDPNRRMARIVTGAYINYPVIMENYADYIYREPLCVGGAKFGYLGKCQLYLSSQMAWLRHVPFLNRYSDELRNPLVKEYVCEQAINKFADYLKLCGEWGVQAVVHINLPHKPYIMKNGSRCSRYKSDFYEDTLENYKGNLLLVDQKVGQLMQLLKESRRYDDATIILTSDHSWRDDPSPDNNCKGKNTTSEQIDKIKQHCWKHVPLIIKRSRQENAKVITNVVYTVDIVPLIQP